MVRADVVEVAGSADNGTWNGPHADLSFAGTSFDVTTNTAGDYFGVDLGTLTLTPGFGVDASTFTVDLTFTLPGTGGADYSALVVGAIGSHTGGVAITFNPLPQEIVTNGGDFWFGVEDFELDLSYGPSRESEPASGSLYGDITCATAKVPEPTSILLFGSVLAGLGFAFRRKRA
jgi:hypothetical protein